MADTNDLATKRKDAYDFITHTLSQPPWNNQLPISTEISHAHAWDEAWVFTGTDRVNPRELGAELDFYLDDEQYIVDKSCIVFLPAGLKHGPCGIRKITRPVFFMTMGNGTEYNRTSGNEE